MKSEPVHAGLSESVSKLLLSRSLRNLRMVARRTSDARIQRQVLRAVEILDSLVESEDEPKH